MEKLLSFCRNLFYCVFWSSFLIFIISSCENVERIPLKKITSEENIKLSEQLLNARYYRGSPSEQMIIEEARKYNDKNPSIPREQAVPFMVNGFLSKAYPLLEEMVQLDSAEWQGYRGFYYLYNYRDYKRALADLDAVDARTPNFVDYPQTQSVDYLRALCYAGLDQPVKALEYIDKHIATEKVTVGENYIYTVAFILKGQAHEQLNQFQLAKQIYEKGIELHPKNADLKYYYGKLLLKLGDKITAADVLMECRQQFKKQEFNTRNYVEEFYQIYIQDIEDAEMSID